MAPSISTVNDVTVVDWPSLPFVSMPAIAPVVVAPRDRIWIRGLGIPPAADPTWRVHALGVTIGDEAGAPLVLGVSTDAEAPCVLAPTLAELETTNAHLSVLAGLSLDYAYQHNGLLLPLALQVEVGNDHSQVVVIGIQLPPPSVGAPRFAGRRASCGGTTGLLADTCNLGGPAHGEVRWYGPSQATAAFASNLPALPALGPWDRQKLVDALTEAIKPALSAPWQTLATLRAAGSPVAPVTWRDDFACFDVPIDPQWGCLGMAVCWRDDIPSRPLPIDLNVELTSVNGRSVIPAPPIGGVVPLIAAPRSDLTIRGTRIQAGARVVAVGIASPEGRKMPLQLEAVPGPVIQRPGPVRKPADLVVRAPNLAELQRTVLNLPLPGGGIRYEYRHNALVAPLVIRVVNPDGTGSLPVAMCASLPAPTLGDPKVARTIVTFKNVTHPVASARRTTNLGGRQTGEIRWYDWGSIDDLRAVHVEDFLPTDLTDMTTVIRDLARHPDCLPQGLADALTPFRPKTPPPVTPLNDEWADDAVAFDIPTRTPFGSAGLAVAWRDDIPSLPVPIVNLYFDCSPSQQTAIQTALQEALNLAWSCLPFAGTPEITVPVLPGASVPVILERISDAADNVLSQLFDQRAANGFDIALWFDAKEVIEKTDSEKTDSEETDSKALATGSASCEPPIPFARNIESAAALVPSVIGPGGRLPLEVRVKPATARLGTGPADPSSIADCATVEIQLMAAFHPPRPAPETCWISDIALGPSIRIHQKPIELPTVAVFFTGDDGGHCHHNPLIVLPPAHGIPFLPAGAWWDIYGFHGVSVDPAYDALAAARQLLLGSFGFAKTLSDTMGSVFHWPWLQTIAEALESMSSVVGSVIDTTGKIDDLGTRVYATDIAGPVKFGKVIESVLLIGPPRVVSNLTFVCRDRLGSETGGNSLALSLRDDQWVAYIPQLSNLPGPWAPPPGVDPPHMEETCSSGQPRSYASGQWGGCIASIEVVEG